MDAMPNTPTRQAIEQGVSDAVVGGETEDATEAAILEAAKRSVEKAAIQLEAALTYLSQLLGDQTRQQPAPEAVEYNRALQAPVIRSSYTPFDGETIYTSQVGIQGPRILGQRHDGLDRLSDRDGVIVSYGTLDEGYDRLDVVAYLLVFESPAYPGVSTFAEPPVVRLAEGTSAGFTDYTIHAVEQIKAALPAVARLRVSDTPAPPSSDTVPAGEIFVDFIESKADWPNDPAQLGTATGDEHARPKTSAHVWLNVELIREAAAQLAVFNPAVTSERAVLHIITHELLHALGFDGGHADPDLYPYSIMHTSPILTQFGTTQGNRLMHWIDSEALAAAYGALSRATVLCPWVPGRGTQFGCMATLSLAAGGRVICLPGRTSTLEPPTAMAYRSRGRSARHRQSTSLLTGACKAHPCGEATCWGLRRTWRQ